MIKAGHAARALAGMRAHYGPMLAKGATTLWESFAPTASLCHGFSASPTYHLVTGLLGLQPTEYDFSTLQIAPQPCDLTEMSGTVRTVKGDVSATLSQAGAQFDMTVTLPEDLPYRIVPPHGYRLIAEKRDGAVLKLGFSR
jgi:alpha-L-rhamnosidase